MAPYAASDSSEIAPTTMGTILMSFLFQSPKTNNISQHSRPGRTERVRESTNPSNTLRTYGRCISRLCSSSSACKLRGANFPVAFSSAIAVQLMMMPFSKVARVAQPPRLVGAHTSMIQRKIPNGRGILLARRQCTSVEVEMMRRA